MKIYLASTNQNKLSALESVLKQFSIFQDATIHAVKVDSGVSDQPLSLEETIEGSKNRAIAAFADDTISIGIEGGLVQLSKSPDYFQIAACTLYDGDQLELGFSSAIHVPSIITNYITEYSCDLEEALYSLNLTEDKKIGRSEGVVGLITQGRLNRKKYLEEAYLATISSYLYQKKII